ncbi:MAG: hypothetical protein JW881_17670 [Spirochaetales bacterium]|nr:hypothetical protein [Spirochaetales bacterium]
MSNDLIYSKFKKVCDSFVHNDKAGARKQAKELVLERMPEDITNEALLSHICTSSLIARLDNASYQMNNLYLTHFEIPQIELFYKMHRAYPQVAASHYIANQFIEQMIGNLLSVTIFDIGIGKGKQLESLLYSLCDRGYNIRNVVIIGLDPDPENLSSCEKTFMQMNGRVYFDVAFHPICDLIENLDEKDFGHIRSIAEGNLVINSAYAMHHVSHPINDTEYRTRLFAKLKSLDPLLFTLTEPNADHDNESLSRRAENCWRHFSVVFNLVDRSDLSEEHKLVIKDMFFGREIRDIFGVSDHLRSERHESTESWMLRLKRAGFRPYDCGHITVRLPDYCEVDIGKGLVRLGYMTTPLIAVFAYR